MQTKLPSDVKTMHIQLLTHTALPFSAHPLHIAHSMLHEYQEGRGERRASASRSAAAAAAEDQPGFGSHRRAVEQDHFEKADHNVAALIRTH